MRSYDILQAPLNIDWNDPMSVRDSLLSTAEFLKENPLVSDFLGLSINQMLQGRSPGQHTESERLEFWQKLAAPYHPDGRRKTS